MAKSDKNSTGNTATGNTATGNTANNVVIVDDDETDGTPFAHPAYWRGEAAGVWGVVSALTDILDGKPRGTFGDSRLEALAVRVEALATDAERWDRVKRLIAIGEPDTDGYMPITFDDSPLSHAAYALWDSPTLGDRENCTNVARVVDEAVIGEKGDG